MGRFFIYIVAMLWSGGVFGQFFSGQIFMKDDTQIYLNHIFVTNLSTHKTTLSNFNGEFSIAAQEGDVVRFTSIISLRKDVKITAEMLQNKNFVELKHGYTEIPELVIRFKPTGNLKADMSHMKSSEKVLDVAKIVGLPAPKGNGLPESQPVALANGGLTFNMESIYDLISGEHKKKLRQQKYDEMLGHTSAIKKYYGEEYFTKLKIPARMIDNFLQFIYISENLDVLVRNNDLEKIKPYIEKYTPIYLKRLKDSHLMEIIEN